MNGEQDGAVVHLVCSADQAKSAILNAQIVLAAPRTTVLMGDCILELVFAFLPQFEHARFEGVRIARRQAYDIASGTGLEIRDRVSDII